MIKQYNEEEEEEGEVEKKVQKKEWKWKKMQKIDSTKKRILYVLI